MEKLILILYAYAKSNGASYSENAEVGSKEELETAVKEFEKSVDEETKIKRYYMESCLSSASRRATKKEMAWLNANEDIGFDGCNND